MTTLQDDDHPQTLGSHDCCDEDLDYDSESSYHSTSSEEETIEFDEAEVLMEVCNDIKECFLRRIERTSIPDIPSAFLHFFQILA